MSYGISLTGLFRRPATMSTILKGAKPADLPVVQPVKFEFVINLRPLRRWPYGAARCSPAPTR